MQRRDREHRARMICYETLPIVCRAVVKRMGRPGNDYRDITDEGTWIDLKPHRAINDEVLPDEVLPDDQLWFRERVAWRASFDMWHGKVNISVFVRTIMVTSWVLDFHEVRVLAGMKPPEFT